MRSLAVNWPLDLNPEKETSLKLAVSRCKNSFIVNNYGIIGMVNIDRILNYSG